MRPFSYLLASQAKLLFRSSLDRGREGDVGEGHLPKKSNNSRSSAVQVQGGVHVMRWASGEVVVLLYLFMLLVFAREHAQG